METSVSFNVDRISGPIFCSCTCTSYNFVDTHTNSFFCSFVNSHRNVNIHLLLLDRSELAVRANCSVV